MTSLPLRYVRKVEAFVEFHAGDTVLDYGCGAEDARAGFEAIGLAYQGWDVSHAAPPGPACIVNLAYVLNVISSLDERAAVVRRAWDLARDALVVTIPRGFCLSEEGGATAQAGCARTRLLNRSWLEAVLDTAVDGVAQDTFVCRRHRGRPGLLRRDALRVAGGVLAAASIPLAAAAEADMVLARASSVIASQLGRDPATVRPQDSLREALQADSLDQVEIVMALEETFGISIGDEEAAKIETVEDAAEVVRKHLQ